MAEAATHRPGRRPGDALTVVRVPIAPEEVAADLGESRRRHQTLVDRVDGGGLLVDTGGGLLAMNAAARQILELSELPVLAARVSDFVLAYDAETGQPFSGTGSLVDSVLRTDEPARDRTVWMTSSDDGIKCLQLSVVPLRHDNESHPYAVLVSLADVTCLGEGRFKPGHLATHDPLTGLPNWHAVPSVARLALQKKVATGSPFALLFVDLDHLTDVNATLGHGAGDEIILAVAHRLRAIVRSTDPIARIGGGEFVVFMEGVRTARAAESVATQLRHALAAPVQVGATTMYPSVSVGIAVYPDMGVNLDELVQAAEMAMRAAKAAGRNMHRVFRPAMRIAIRERLWLETHLNEALMQRQFNVVYQPKVDARTGSVVGVEALLRWIHPDRGSISPRDFIPCAEETGHIVAIGGFVLQQACVQAKRWLDAGIDWPVAVNLSPRQFRDPNLQEDIEEALSSNDLPASNLHIEITESCLLDGDANARDIIEALRARGVSVHIDDFGTGYSCLARMGILTFDALKIDSTFTAAIATDPRTRSLIESIIAIARALKMTVVAEGVETEEQREILLGMGCSVQQGFLFAHPMPAEEMTARLFAARVANH